MVCRWETLGSAGDYDDYDCGITSPASATRPAPGLRMPMGIRIDWGAGAGLATRDVMAGENVRIAQAAVKGVLNLPGKGGAQGPLGIPAGTELASDCRGGRRTTGAPR